MPSEWLGFIWNEQGLTREWAMIYLEVNKDLLVSGQGLIGEWTRTYLEVNNFLLGSEQWLIWKWTRYYWVMNNDLSESGQGITGDKQWLTWNKVLLGSEQWLNWKWTRTYLGAKGIWFLMALCKYSTKLVFRVNAKPRNRLPY